MRLICRERIDKDSKEYLLEISGSDFLNLQLDPLDIRLMEECEASDSISDKLLMLEMLARRCEQQKEHNEIKAKKEY